MNALLEAIFTGFVLACASSLIIGLAFFFSRPYRQGNNRFAIHMAQAIAVASILGSLLLMQAVERWLGVKWHSTTHHATRWAYIACLLCAIFLILRADLVWQKSVGMYKKAAKSADKSE
jgi:uncharacterized membrane protein